VSPPAYGVCSFLPVLRRASSRPPIGLLPVILSRNTLTVVTVYLVSWLSSMLGYLAAAGVSAATGFLCGYGFTPLPLTACLTLPQSVVELAALYLACLAGRRRRAGLKMLAVCIILLCVAAVIEVFATPRLCLLLACTLCR